MELQTRKEYYLFSLLEGWLKMEVNFPNLTKEESLIVIEEALKIA